MLCPSLILDDRYLRKNARCSNIKTSPYYQSSHSLNFSEATNLCDNDASCVMFSGDSSLYFSFHLCDGDAKIVPSYTSYILYIKTSKCGILY